MHTCICKGVQKFRVGRKCKGPRLTGHARGTGRTASQLKGFCDGFSLQGSVALQDFNPKGLEPYSLHPNTKEKP